MFFKSVLKVITDGKKKDSIFTKVWKKIEVNISGSRILNKKFGKIKISTWNSPKNERRSASTYTMFSYQL